MEYGSKFNELRQFGRHLVDTKHRKANRFEYGIDFEIHRGITECKDIY